jgi:hypothetical protein
MVPELPTTGWQFENLPLSSGFCRGVRYRDVTPPNLSLNSRRRLTESSARCRRRFSIH